MTGQFQPIPFCPETHLDLFQSKVLKRAECSSRQQGKAKCTSQRFIYLFNLKQNLSIILQIIRSLLSYVPTLARHSATGCTPLEQN